MLRLPGAHHTAAKQNAWRGRKHRGQKVAEAARGARAHAALHGPRGLPSPHQVGMGCETRNRIPAVKGGQRSPLGMRLNKVLPAALMKCTAVGDPSTLQTFQTLQITKPPKPSALAKKSHLQLSPPTEPFASPVRSARSSAARLSPPNALSELRNAAAPAAAGTGSDTSKRSQSGKWPQRNFCSGTVFIATAILAQLTVKLLC